MIAVHLHRAGVEPVVEHVLAHARVLGQPVDDVHERAVDARPADQHQRQPGSERDGRGDRADVDRQPDARGAVDLGPLGLGHVVGLVRGEATRGVQRPCALNATGTSKSPKKLPSRRASRAGRMAWISGSRPSDQRVGVVAGVAPTRRRRVTHDHEAGDLVDGLVEPARHERGAVARPRASASPTPSRRARRRPRKNGTAHQLPHSAMPAPAHTTIRPTQIAVSRTAGMSERRISSFIRLRGIGDRYHAPFARSGVHGGAVLRPREAVAAQSRTAHASSSTLSSGRSAAVGALYTASQHQGVQRRGQAGERVTGSALRQVGAGPVEPRTSSRGGVSRVSRGASGRAIRASSMRPAS